MGSEKTQNPKTGRRGLKLPIPFEEAVADILKVKPPPEKKRRGGKHAGGEKKAVED